jgi:hypothetical protein
VSRIFAIIWRGADDGVGVADADAPVEEDSTAAERSGVTGSDDTAIGGAANAEKSIPPLPATGVG